MTTYTYRKRHRAEIDRLERQWGRRVDVGHIVARANGGADHPDNYIFTPHDLNQIIGHRRDDIMYAYAGATKTRKAVLVSQRLGNSKETVLHAEQLRRGAKKDLKMLLINMGYCGIDVPDLGACAPNSVKAQVVVEDGDDDMVERALEKARSDPQYFLEIIDAWNKLKD